jgi:uncharacterized protein YkwD
MRTVVVAAAIAAACSWPLPDRADASTGDRVRHLLNVERAAHGLGPLRPDRRLARAAREHSTDMVAHRYFAHTAPDGRRSVDRIRSTGWLDGRARWWVGEDLAWGIGAFGTPAGIVRAWMHSPEHRRVLLGRVYRCVGIGVASGTPFGRGRGRTVTADFGSGRA